MDRKGWKRLAHRGERLQRADRLQGVVREEEPLEVVQACAPPPRLYS
jgi:hypothetical protein